MLKKIGNQLLSPVGLGLLFCIGLPVIVLSAQSWTVLPAYAPYALLLLCPLMHLFMHRGMHHHGAQLQNQPQQGEVHREVTLLMRSVMLVCAIAYSGRCHRIG
jgi:hypothetical protein